MNTIQSGTSKQWRQQVRVVQSELGWVPVRCSGQLLDDADTAFLHRSGRAHRKPTRFSWATKAAIASRRPSARARLACRNNFGSSMAWPSAGPEKLAMGVEKVRPRSHSR